MSALTALPLVDGGRRRRTERPRLVLVPTGDAVRVDPARGRGVGLAGSPDVHGSSLRLTRRGRLALTLAFASLALALAAALLAASLGVVGGADAPGLERVTVAPGQTLSEIAEAHTRGLSLEQAVTQLQVANNLDSAQVSAGQVLVIPRS